jgi:aerobic carbon-monoxide dehydrogenase small subunit
VQKYTVLNINGDEYRCTFGKELGQIPYSETLAQTLRERIGLTEIKLSCGQGGCGRCAVLIDGKVIASCMTLTSECDGKKIVTFEGLQNDPVQKAVLDYPDFQCQVCKPGITMAAKAIFNKNPHPAESEIKEGLSGNFCRIQKECGIETRLVSYLFEYSNSK